MTTAKTQIINRFINTFQQSNIVNPSGAPLPLINVVRKLVLLDEINDFPYVCVLAPRERREHNGSGEKIGIIEVTIRGYVVSEADDGIEISTLDKAEELGIDFDSIIALFLDGTCQNNVFDARLISLRTDEGLFEPYGILDAKVEVYYLLS